MAYAPTKASPNVVPQPLHYLGEAFDKATLPAAASYKNRIVVCVDGGASNAPCLAISDGIGWFTIAVGAVIA